MSYNPNNPNGSATSANSAPVVIASDQSTIPTSLADLYVSGAASQTAIVNNILTSTSGTAGIDLSGYRTAAVQVVSTGTAGTFIFEASNDSVNWVTTPVWNQLILTGTPIVAAITATASSIIYTFPVNFRYLRLRIATAITGGNIQAFSRFSQENFTPGIFQVAQATAANLQATVAGTVSANLNAGSNVIGKVNVAAIASGGATSFTLISAATTNATLVKSSAGTLYMLTATNNGASVAFLKVYNKASAPTVGTDVPVLTFLLPAGGGITVPFPAAGVNFATGISYAVTGSATTADTTAVALSQIQVNGAFI